MNMGYTGKPYDAATGLYNYGYRDYRPQAARFTTVDPIRDGNNWFAYVNNDPVNWIDLWGLCTSDNTNWDDALSFEDTVGITFTAPRPDSNAGQIALDIFGKTMAAPMTAIGIYVGTALIGISYFTNNSYSIDIANNAISFTFGFDLGGAITLGNVIIYAGKDADKNQYKEDLSVTRYDGEGKVNLGLHEEAHTYQYQQFGVLTIPLLIGSAIINGGFNGSSFDIGKSNFEKAADDYAQKFVK